ncbi:MAG: WYL domain-containing protein [Pseudomonadota bacterium]|uniref:helix-turn-helix transcriptional regulator n=1 Tax=Acinetobacter ursingii TaxID=108980 RepID=UPI002EB17767|nr:WYL domain-containing protein [Pseudomonadota bacterium]
MTKKESEHVRVAQRITSMLCQLNEGKALNTNELAREHQVSRRTVQRDINERLAVVLPLDLNEHGHYILPSGYLGQLNFDDIRHFAMLVGVSDLFPNMDRQFLRRLLDKDAKHIYASKGQFNEDGSKFKGLFDQIEPAILDQHKVTLYYKGSYQLVEPYRIINHRSCWYLAAVKESKLRAYRLSFVKGLTVHIDQPVFEQDQKILEQIDAEESIWFGQDKQEAILTINAKVAEYFRLRNLLPYQQIVKEMDDGSLLVSSQYVSETQIISLIRYWIPHIHVVSPDCLRNELINSLNGYIK